MLISLFSIFVTLITKLIYVFLWSFSWFYFWSYNSSKVPLSYFLWIGLNKKTFRTLWLQWSCQCISKIKIILFFFIKPWFKDLVLWISVSLKSKLTLTFWLLVHFFLPSLFVFEMGHAIESTFVTYPTFDLYFHSPYITLNQIHVAMIFYKATWKAERKISLE